jgi:Fe-S cluster assembly protein SufD
MTTTTTDPSSIIAAIQQPATEGPAWFKDLQVAALQEFEGEPFPARGDETWRFSSIKNLSLDNYLPAPAFYGEVSTLTSSCAFQMPAGRIVFANDILVSAELYDSSLAQQGVIFTTLAEGLEKHSTLLQEHFMAQPAKLGSKKFAALHKAALRAGTVLGVPRGVEISAPFEVFHLVQGDGSAVFPHTLIIAEENSKVTFLEHFVSADPTHRGFACGVNDLVLKPGSKLTYVSVQEWSQNFMSMQVNSTVVNKDANALNLALNFGGKYSRLESVSRMMASGARSDMLAINIGKRDQEFDQRTLQDHLRPNTTSDLLYKNALFDKARTIFSGLIRVEPGAHRTDAYQKVRNLLLSAEAEANSMPGLEILADDVRCTHGATTGEIESEELFYLLSRGINEASAKALIVRGFLNEVVDRLESPLLEYLHNQIECQLRANSLACRM